LLGGLLGGILAIPLTAALRVLMFRYVWRKHEAWRFSAWWGGGSAHPPRTVHPAGRFL